MPGRPPDLAVSRSLGPTPGLASISALLVFLLAPGAVSAAGERSSQVDDAGSAELAPATFAWSRPGESRRWSSPKSQVADGQRATDELVVLYINSALYGTGSGLLLGWTLGADSAAGLVVPGVLGAGVAAGAVALLDGGSSPLPYGVPQSISVGLRLGLMEGVLWAGSLAGWAGGDLAPGFAALGIWGTTTVGAIVGGAVGRGRRGSGRPGTTPGRAAWVESVATWPALVAGLVTSSFWDPVEEDDDVECCVERPEWSLEGGALVGLVVFNLGLVAGLSTAEWVSPSIDRMRLVDLGGLAGGLVGGGFYAAAGAEDGLFAAVGAGLAVGVTTAWFSTGDMAPDDPSARKRRAGSASLRLGVLPTDGGGLLGAHGAW